MVVGRWSHDRPGTSQVEVGADPCVGPEAWADHAGPPYVTGRLRQRAV